MPTATDRDMQPEGEKPAMGPMAGAAVVAAAVAAMLLAVLAPSPGIAGRNASDGAPVGDAALLRLARGL